MTTTSRWTRSRRSPRSSARGLHWQVTEKGDGVEVWGTAGLHTDLDAKRRLWSGVFDYDFDAFAPGGPENSPGTGFIAVRPTRALVLYRFGAAGAKRWRAS